ncbi:hypothetical protein NLJ89_g6957 [Agrocybe chaxingu]|uniref:Uncharacterized protein n=1 Tax=Agrocybe chaxingu TaxID=84603 RepID=A0A9W8JXL2_9AGAR|nr:hypothetical protein NLJ89_g6957 [Agrocybe chaxingu]
MGNVAITGSTSQNEVNPGPPPSATPPGRSSTATTARVMYGSELIYTLSTHQQHRVAVVYHPMCREYINHFKKNTAQSKSVHIVNVEMVRVEQEGQGERVFQQEVEKGVLKNLLGEEKKKSVEARQSPQGCQQGIRGSATTQRFLHCSPSNNAGHAPQDLLKSFTKSRKMKLTHHVCQEDDWQKH